MSLMQTFIDLEQKLEHALKEVRVGFPEGLKQQLLAWGYDVSVWMSEHHMEVIASLAVTLMLVVGLFTYVYVKSNKAKLAAIASLEAELVSERLNKEFWQRRATYWLHRYTDATTELEEFSDTVADQAATIHELRTEVDETLSLVTTLQDKVADLETDLKDAEESAEHWEEKWDDATDEVSDLQDQVEKLTELSERYSDLVVELDKAA